MWFADFVCVSEINYISRNILFLGYDSRGMDYGYSIQKFLEEYESANTTIPKCGTIRQAVNIDIENGFTNLYLKASKTK